MPSTPGNLRRRSDKPTGRKFVSTGLDQEYRVHENTFDDPAATSTGGENSHRSGARRRSLFINPRLRPQLWRPRIRGRRLGGFL
jgi:hypothetical protein